MVNYVEHIVFTALVVALWFGVIRLAWHEGTSALLRRRLDEWQHEYRLLELQIELEKAKGGGAESEIAND